MSMRRQGWTALAFVSCAAMAGAGEPYDYFASSGWEECPVVLASQEIPSPSDMPPPESDADDPVPPPPLPASDAEDPVPPPPIPATSAPPSVPPPASVPAPAPYRYECPPARHGSVCASPTLLGDVCGVRPALGESGIAVTADVTQFYYGVASGGLDREFRYSGHGDYVAMLDGEKLLGMQGFFVKLRAEHRFGETIDGATGALLPSTILPDLPNPASENLYLTNVLLTQALSENFAVYAGKLDTFDGDHNAFASGRGKTQFSNLGFVINPAMIRTVPYSTLGAGFMILDEGHPIFTFGVLNSIDTARSTGFGKLFEEGCVLTAEGRLPTNLLGMPGHQLLGGTYSTRTFASTGQDPRVVLPDVPVNQESGSWGLFWNCDQYVETYDEAQTRGWGLFARAGLADDQTSSVAWFLSGGVGGNSPICGREADTFGAGWWYSATSSDLATTLSPILGPIGDGQAVELFYNVQVTPWLHVTPDFQVVMPARESVDTALVAGVRANLAF